MDQTEYAESVINKYAHYLGNRKVKKTPLPSNVNERISQEEICRMKRNSLYSISLFSRKWERYCISPYSLDLTCPSLSTLYLGSLTRNHGFLLTSYSRASLSQRNHGSGHHIQWEFI